MEGTKRAWPVVLAATVVAGLIGFGIGLFMVPDNAGLEGIVYPGMGSLVGAAIGLVLALATVAMARSKRGRGDL